MPEGPRVAMLSVHTSPLDQPGTGDAGGMNVYVTELAAALAARGATVDVFTRAADPGQPDRDADGRGEAAVAATLLVSCGGTENSGTDATFSNSSDLLGANALRRANKKSATCAHWRRAMCALAFP